MRMSLVTRPRARVELAQAAARREHPHAVAVGHGAARRPGDRHEAVGRRCGADRPAALRPRRRPTPRRRRPAGRAARSHSPAGPRIGIRATTRFVAGSMRSSCTGPWSPAYRRSPASAHTAPAPAATRASPGTGMRARTRRVAGSIRRTCTADRIRRPHGAEGRRQRRQAGRPPGSCRAASGPWARARRAAPGRRARRRARAARRREPRNRRRPGQPAGALEAPRDGPAALLAQRRLAQLQPQLGHEILGHRRTPSARASPPAPAHPLAHDRLRGRELARDLVVRALLEHVRGDRSRCSGARRSISTRASSASPSRSMCAKSSSDELDPLHAQPPPCAPLGVAPAQGVGQLVRRDPVQPRRRGARLRAVAPAPGQRGRERLRAQVGRQLGVAGAAGEEAQHRVDVTAVERARTTRRRARSAAVHRSRPDRAFISQFAGIQPV